MCPHCGFSPLPAQARRCSQCQASLDEEPAPARVRKATQVESLDKLRRPAKPVRTPTMKEAAPKAAAKEKAQPFHPTQRPPMLLLCIADDGRDTGELIRVRTPRLVIGRTEGDVLIPHDNVMSGQHVELVSAVAGGRVRWRVRDLNSANGTFVRVNAAMLKDGQEILVGSRRLRFDAARAPSSASPAGGAAQNSTGGWQAVTRETIDAKHPSIMELNPQGEGSRTPLSGSEHWIGSENTAAVVLADDPFVSARHARLFADSHGRWHIEDGGSLNGTWLRIDEVPVDTHAEFIAGEQRFLVRVLGHEDSTTG